MRAPIAWSLLACLAAAAWFLCENIQPVPFAPTTAETSPGVPMPATAVTQTPVPTDKAQPLGTAVESAANQREAVPPLFAGPNGEVQVVHFDTKAPIAGATVYCLPPDFESHTLSAELQELLRNDRDALLQQTGLAFSTDADGRCRVPLGPDATHVSAVKDELWGQGYLRKGATESTVILLRADRTLHVLVVDAGGKPVRGSMVVGTRKHGSRTTNSQMGETNAAGRLEHRHVHLLANAETAKIEFVASMPGCKSAPLLVDVTAPPPEVLLQLPPGGTVTVHVRDAEGRSIDPTFLDEPNANLAVVIKKPSENAVFVFPGHGDVRIDEHGDAVFNPVEFDRFVIASVAHGRAVVQGPTLANRYVDVVVSEGADDVVLTGTLLDADGMPLASSQFSATCKCKSVRGGQRGRTDASGRFRLAVAQLPTGQEITVSFTKVVSGAAPQACELPPRLLTRGRNDLGEVRLARR